MISRQKAAGHKRPEVRMDEYGEPFRGLGENSGWEWRIKDDSRLFSELHQSPRYNYGYLLGRLSAAGGNFFRAWRYLIRRDPGASGILIARPFVSSRPLLISAMP